MSKDMPGHDEAENKTRDALTNATNNPEVFQAERDRRVQEFRQRAQEVSSDVVDESPPSGQQHSYNHKKAFSDHYQSKRGYVKKSPAESFAERRMAYMVDENVLAKHKESKKKEDRENWKQSKTPTKYVEK